MAWYERIKPGGGVAQLIREALAAAHLACPGILREKEALGDTGLRHIHRPEEGTLHTKPVVGFVQVVSILAPHLFHSLDAGNAAFFEVVECPAQLDVPCLN